MNAKTQNPAFVRFVAIIAACAKTTVNAMKDARETMESKDLCEGAAAALTAKLTEYKSLPNDKRKASPLASGIRAAYKNMSTAISHERRNLRKELNDETAENAALFSRFPYRVAYIKGCYVVLAHAEFASRNANRVKPAPVKTTHADDNDGETVPADRSKTDKLIAQLEAQLRDMTANRDVWMNRAVKAETALAALTPAKAIKPRTSAAASARGKSGTVAALASAVA